MDELIKISEDMEISIINFIVNNLFIKSFFIQKEMGNKILSIILYDKTELKEEDKIKYKSFTIENLNINSLFEICKIKEKEEIKNEFNEINKK